MGKLVSNKVVSRAALIQASRVFKDTLAASSPAMAVAVAMVAKASASALAPAPATEEAEEDIEDTARATRRRVPTSSSLNSRRTTRDSSTTDPTPFITAPRRRVLTFRQRFQEIAQGP